MAQAAKKTEPKEVRNSRFVDVIITKKNNKSKSKVFASTTIMEKGRKVLKPYRIPVDVKVSIPVEIARIIKDRKVADFVNDKQVMISEFLIEQADSSF